MNVCKKLDHILINKRFVSAIRRHKVLVAPVVTGHCAVLTDVRVTWAVASKAPVRRHWWQLRHPDLREAFTADVRRRLAGTPTPTWAEMAQAVRDAGLAIPPPPDRQQTPQQEAEEGARAALDQGLRGIFKATRKKSVLEELESHHNDDLNRVIHDECTARDRQVRYNPQQAFRFINRLTGRAKQELTVEGASTREKLEKVRQFFATMGGDAGEDVDVAFPDASPLPRSILDGKFRLSEMLAASKQFDRGKAPGSDEFPIEAIRAMLTNTDLAIQLLCIINLVLETGVTEVVWRLIMQVPIPKKGNLGQLANWRPICLLNVVVKLMDRMIYNRMVPVVDEVLRGNQFGFRASRSTNGAMATFAEMMGKAVNSNEGIAVCFVDFCKAFPSISFKAIREALRAFHVPPQLTQAIMSMYSGLRGFVRTPFGKTDEFDITTGTLQGDVLAPFLFIMVLDRVLATALKGRGVTIRKAEGTRSRPRAPAVKISDIDYADDLVLLAMSKVELQEALEAVKREAWKVNLKINVGPTKTAWFTCGPVRDSEGDLAVEGLGVIPHVTEYRHLGNLRGEDNKLLALNDRVRLAWAATHRLRPLWNMNLRVDTKLKVFDTVVMPTLLYGAGTWTITDRQAHEVDHEVHRMRRMVCGVKVYRTNILSLYGNAPLFSTAQKVERARLIGHLLRQKAATPFMHAAEWRRDEERPKRQPCLTDACAMDLNGPDKRPRDPVVTTTMLQELAEDREQWRGRLRDIRLEHEPVHDYVRVYAKSWKKARARCETLADFQFIEEGSEPFPMFHGELHCYTDGSALTETLGEKAQHAAGYGVVFRTQRLGIGNVAPISKPLLYDHEQTNNVAELSAAIDGCETAFEMRCYTVVLHTDSAMIWNWFHNVRRRHRLSGYHGFENADLLQKLDAAIRKITETVVHGVPGEVYVVKVRAHNGNPYNDEVDQAAGFGANASSLTRCGENGPKAPERDLTDTTIVDSAIREREAARRRRAKWRACTKARIQREKAQREAERQSQRCQHRRPECLSQTCHHRCCNRHGASVLTDNRHAPASSITY